MMKSKFLFLNVLISFTTFLNAIGAVWTQKQSMSGDGITRAVAFAINNNGIVATGEYYNKLTYDNRVWKYSPSNDNWSIYPHAFDGSGRSNAVSFVIGDKGYLGTGDNNSGRKKDFWMFNYSTSTWTQIADFGGTARTGAVAFSIGNKGYVGTGYDGNFRKDFWEYDAETNTWTQIAEFPGSARSNAVGFAISGKGFIGTGTSGSDKYDFWVYDPINNSWTRKADFPGTQRNAAIGFAIGNKGYIGTGVTGSNTYYKDFWEYDLETNSWRKTANLPGAKRKGAFVFVVGNKAYVGCGYDGTNVLSDLWEFDPAEPEINIKYNTNSIADNSGNVNIGDVVVGESYPIPFTIENTGTKTLNLTSSPRVTLSGEGFTLTADAPVTIEPGHTATFQVTFSPNTCGEYTATVSIANDDSNENPFNFTISGRGVGQVSLTSASGTDDQQVCVNSPISEITYSTSNFTGATFLDLPEGVSGSFDTNTGNILIAGTPLAAGTFNYTINLSGCNSVSVNGTITVKPLSTITLTSSQGTNYQTICQGTAINDITYSTTEATGASFSGLPNGVIGEFDQNTESITISGTPSEAGTFTYQVNLEGCGDISENGTIVVQPHYSVDTNAVACDQFTWYGETFTESGDYTKHFQSIYGCDSTVTLHLTINSIDVSVTLNGNTLTANQENAQYQWINCDTNSPIEGATTQSFTPSVTGSYAIQVSDGICEKTSDCYSVTITAIDDNPFFNEVAIYPNPSNGNFMIDLPDLKDVKVKIFDSLGRAVYKNENVKTKHLSFYLNEGEGVYIMQLTSGNQKKHFKLILKK